MRIANHRLDHESCYRAVLSRDRRFDGVFYTAVRSTGIYCRPSCPARTPAVANVEFHRTAAAAQAAGFRACKRCLPDATPGSPDWDAHADVAGRAMRLIADGVVDREGVEGLAARLGYTSRHLNRVLTERLGAGALALARARRAQTARVLIENSRLRLADVAFAAGFSSVRQFNDTVREVYAASPSELRGRGRPGGGPRPASPGSLGTIAMRIAVRTPFAGGALADFLALRAVRGVEAVGRTESGPRWYARTLALPHGVGTVRVELPDLQHTSGVATVDAWFRLTDLRDTGAAVERVRRLLDADCDPVAVATQLSTDPVLGRLVRHAPGLRVPGHVDGAELAVRAVLGQQISVAAARGAATRLVDAFGTPLDHPDGELTHLFPAPQVLARLEPGSLPMPRSRGRALVGLCAALAAGDLALDRGPDRDDVHRRLLRLPGIGAWTAGYIAMRALGHPDVLLDTDAATRRAFAAVGLDGASIATRAAAWRPWRSYAQLHLWQALSRYPSRGGTTRCGP